MDDPVHRSPASAPRFRRQALATAVCAVACLLPAVAANAQEPLAEQASSADWTEAAATAETLPPIDPTAAGAAECPKRPVERPFLPFGDARGYVLAPGGTFEAESTGWALSDATVAPGNEPWYVHSDADTASLRVPNGTTVTSAPMCVDLDYPTFRLFMREKLTAPSSILGVDVVYADAEGSPTQAVGRLSGTGGWQLTPDIAVLPELGGTEPGGRLVRFRFTARGGSIRIDDLYVDPRNRH
jgi:hypothetical protein